MQRIVALVLLLLLASAHGAEPELVRVGTFAAAPYLIEQDQAVPTGAIVEFFDQEVAPRMGVKFQWLPVVTPARLVLGLKDGHFQFTPILTRTPEREQLVRYSDKSYVGFSHTLVVRPDHPLVQSARLELAQLSGLSIGWIQAGPLPDVLNEVPQIRWDLSGSPKWETSNLQKLVRRRLDAAYFSNPHTPAYYALRDGLKVTLLPLPIPERPLFAAFAPTVSSELVQRYERAAKEAFASGRFERFLKAYTLPR